MNLDQTGRPRPYRSNAQQAPQEDPSAPVDPQQPFGTGYVTKPQDQGGFAWGGNGTGILPTPPTPDYSGAGTQFSGFGGPPTQAAGGMGAYGGPGAYGGGAPAQPQQQRPYQPNAQQGWGPAGSGPGWGPQGAGAPQGQSNAQKAAGTATGQPQGQQQMQQVQQNRQQQQQNQQPKPNANGTNQGFGGGAGWGPAGRP